MEMLTAKLLSLASRSIASFHLFNIILLVIVLSVGFGYITAFYFVRHVWAFPLYSTVLLLYPLTIIGALSLIVQNLWLTLKWRLWEHYRPPAPVNWKEVDVKAILAKNAPATGLRYGIIGAGSLGISMVSLLRLRGEKNVRTFDLRPLSPEAAVKVGTENHTVGSITDPVAVENFCKGLDVVIHNAAFIAFYTNYPEDYPPVHKVNVEGTENIIRACKSQGVKMLIYTSTSNVFNDASISSKKLEIDEDNPGYAKRPLNHYTATKSIAEQKVLAAHDPKGLWTTSIRPCSGLFGPKDAIHIEMDLKWMCTLIVTYMFLDWVYVENVSYAHLLAERKLLEGVNGVGGVAFLVSNDEPLSNVDLRRRLRYFWPDISLWVVNPTLVNVLSMVYEGLYKIGFRLDKRIPSTVMMSRCVVQYAALSYVSISTRAREVLGYTPLYTVDQALQKTVHLSRNPLDEYPATPASTRT